MKTIEQQVADLGWELICKHVNADVSQFHDYRACQGGFCTPWRYSAEEVLKDLLLMDDDEKALNWTGKTTKKV
jgi:hypothetical protein